MRVLGIVSAKYLFVVSPLLVALAAAKLEQQDRIALFKRLVVSGIIGILMAKIGGALFYEPRPFVVQHAAPLIPHDADNGFPSDHTLLVFLFAFLLIPFSRQAGMLALLTAGIVAAGRIACKLHSPLDIAASTLMAGAAALLASRLVPRTPSDRMPGVVN